MTLTNIAAACNGKLQGLNSNENKKISGVAIDSRLVKKDYLFIATPGEKVDGHDFIQAAFEQGARAVICEKVPSHAKGPYILVDDSLLALRQIATWYRLQLDIKVVGITGSVGKTSAKEFVSNVLSQKYNILKTEGNFNNEIGLPLTILRIRDYHEIAVLEMGINHFGEMSRLSNIAKPDIAIITNIGDSHLEFLGSRQGVLKAKSEIFDFINPDAKVILNGNDPLLTSIQEVKGQKPIFFGIDYQNHQEASSDNRNSLDIYATDIKSQGLYGSTCNIHSKDQLLKANIPIPGQHMIYNALIAATTGLVFKLPPNMIADGIQSIKSLGGRNNIIKHNKFTIIDDCYNANPVSMKAALDLLEMADTRKVAVIGDMGELGDKEIDLHTDVGRYATSKKIDVLVCIGPLSKNTYHAVTNNPTPSSISKSLYYKTKEEFIEDYQTIIKEEDTILIKASNYMGFNNIIEVLLKS